MFINRAPTTEQPDSSCNRPLGGESSSEQRCKQIAGEKTPQMFSPAKVLIPAAFLWTTPVV